MMTRRIVSYVALVVIVSLATVATGCHITVTPGLGPPVTGSGTLETREMDYADFTKITVGSAFKVDITEADSYLISITLDNNLFEYLDTKKLGGTLYIGLKSNRTYIDTTQQATVTLPALHELELSGASKANVSDFSSSHAVELNLSGASHLDVNDMKTGDARFEISGASKASGNIEIGDGKFNLSGASTMDLEGSGNDVSIQASGASRVSLGDFEVTNAAVVLSGASSATLNASGELDADLSGASKLYYVGNPTFGKIETSGGSTISQK